MTSALEILQVDQPGKPWKAFAPRARALADSLACSMSDGAGPVHLNGPRKPVEMQRLFVEIPKVVVAHKAQSSAVIIAKTQDLVVKVIDDAGAALSLADIAERAGLTEPNTRNVLHRLKAKGLVARIGGYRTNVTWGLVDSKESAA